MDVEICVKSAALNCLQSTRRDKNSQIPHGLGKYKLCGSECMLNDRPGDKSGSENFILQTNQSNQNCLNSVRISGRIAQCQLKFSRSACLVRLRYRACTCIMAKSTRTTVLRPVSALQVHSVFLITCGCHCTQSIIANLFVYVQ